MAKRVLLVEDEPIARKALRGILEIWGYTVQEAEDGFSGVIKALSWQPEIAIVDIGLPVLDGFELARQVREKVQHAVSLIALTGFQEPDFFFRADEVGFDHYVVKPADLEELKRTLARIDQST